MGGMASGNLDAYIGAVIDIDGSRYRLAGLDGADAVLADLGRAGVLVHMSVDEVSEAMVQVVRYDLRSQPGPTLSPDPLSR
jgi:hypothetical protein